MLKTNQVFIVTVLSFFSTINTVLSDVCISSGCRKASTDILSFIDPSVDPCLDFYKFACSGIFKKSYEGKPVSLKAYVSKEVDDQITSMLKKAPHPSEPKAVQALKKFFSLCMNETNIEKAGIRSLKNALESLGGWPAIEGPRWNENEFKVEELLIKLRKLGLEFKQLFYFGSTVDLKNPSLVLTEPYVPYIDDTEIESYYEYMVNVAVKLGAVKEVASSDLQKALQFKLKFRRVLDNADQCRISSIHSIKEEFPFFDWLYLINNIIHPNKNISVYDKLYFPSRKYLNNLVQLLSETPSRTLANYVIWQAVEDVIMYLPKQFREFKQEYEGVSTSRKESRLHFCRNETKTILPPAFEAFYIRQHFNSNKRQKATEIVTAVKEELQKLIQSTKIYDEETRSKMLKKLEQIAYYTGAPEKLLDENIFSELFDKDEDISGINDFLEFTALLKREAANLAVRVKNVKDYYNLLYEEAISVEAFFEPLSNSLAIPAAIFQGLYFADNRPQYMNFGTVGTLLASALMHAFNEDGNNYGTNNLEEFGWTNKTKSNYDQKTECIINEANVFSIEDSSLPINGSQILEEIVCDYTGVEIAYRAYQNWLNIHGEEKILPGIDYTPKQLFWISVASTFCDTVSLDILQEFILNETVGHPTFRSFGSLSNNRNFGKDFTCALGLRMNPSMKCIIF